MASVLIAEPDQGLRLYAHVIFRDAGHRVTSVGDRDQLPSMLASQRFDLAVIGELAPTAQLIELVAEPVARTRIVLHVADADALLAHSRLEHLPKPARPAELLALTSLGSGLELV